MRRPRNFPRRAARAHRRDPGGTYVISQGGAATGAIGTVRVGGAATNFTTFVTEDPLDATASEGQLDAKIANFYIGGQTNNVMLLAPSGARDVVVRPRAWTTSRSIANAHPVTHRQPRRDQFQRHGQPLDRQSGHRWRRSKHQRQRRRVPEPVHVRQRIRRRYIRRARPGSTDGLLLARSAADRG